MVCLDTSFLVDLMREKRNGKKGPAQTKSRELAERGEVPRTTVITLSELYVGPYRARDAARELEKIERIAEEMEILYVTKETARRFGSIVADLYRIGRAIGVMDAFIAALALENGDKLVTRNTRDFENVSGLELEGY